MRLAEEVEKNKDTVSTVALICGAGGLVVLFLVPVLGFLMMLTGIVTGAIGMSTIQIKNQEQKPWLALWPALQELYWLAPLLLRLPQCFTKARALPPYSSN